MKYYLSKLSQIIDLCVSTVLVVTYDRSIDNADQSEMIETIY